MKVFISDITFEKVDRYGNVYSWITGHLNSGLDIKIHNYFYDLQKYIDHYVEMLLCVLRSPYLEYEKGLSNQPFSSEKFYSLELIGELEEKENLNSKDNGIIITLTGEYIDSFDIPQKWLSHIKSKWSKIIPKEPSAINTEDGIFLLYPFHLKKKIPVEMFPKFITIATGTIDLIAWYPFTLLD